MRLFAPRQRFLGQHPARALFRAALGELFRQPLTLVLQALAGGTQFGDALLAGRGRLRQRREPFKRRFLRAVQTLDLLGPANDAGRGICAAVKSQPVRPQPHAVACHDALARPQVAALRERDFQSVGGENAAQEGTDGPGLGVCQCRQRG